MVHWICLKLMPHLMMLIHYLFKCFGQKYLKGRDDSYQFMHCNSNQCIQLPDFEDKAAIESLLTVLEQSAPIEQLLKHVIDNDQVSVYIGSEINDERLNDCGLVGVPIALDGVVIAAIGVLGPLRMSYQSVISLLTSENTLAELHSSLIQYRRFYDKRKKETKKKSTKKDSSNKQIKQLEAQINALQQQVLDITKERDDLIAGANDAKDQSLRSLAELENVKRRKEQEKVDAIKFANERLIMDLLPVLDSFELAMGQTNQSDHNDIASILKGF